MKQQLFILFLFLFASCQKDATFTPQCGKENTFAVEVHATANNLTVTTYDSTQTVKPITTYKMKINEVKSFEFPSDKLSFIGFDYGEGNKEFWTVNMKSCEKIRFTK